MKDPISMILLLFGYEFNKRNTLLYNHIHDVTNESWIGSLQRKNQLAKYTYNLYTY